ncbi:DNA replication terminus site-binding protein [Marinobacter sp. X15-166B]|uniref:DNA replication terminus site-binding protein n=1 Tax=Marinobacter sp. X15-166B TaxID=1897620 RepID=UPI00085CBEE1|nr:DNA replication terminus site-binding protein [Marinobacter sp. X15-166B]OEY67580.1 hypothetical protein BG841_14825 [Marinobacter sp. X15-166B]
MSKYTASQLQAIEDINVRIAALRTVLNDLKSALRQCDLVQARVAVVPRPKKEDEEIPPERIEPQALSGQEAFDRTLFALTDWYGDGVHSTKAVARTPGAVVLQSEEATANLIGQLAHDANVLKDQIRQLIPRLGNRDDRFELLHNHHHMLVTLQLIRQLLVLPSAPPVQSLTFTWGVKTEIKKVTVEQTCQRIARYLTAPPPQGMTAGEWQSSVNTELARVSSLPENTELRHRRVLVVRPMVNIRRHLSPAEREARREKWAQEGKFDQPVTLREAHTPLIAVNPSHPIKVGALGIYCALERRQRRQRSGRKTAEEPISPLVPVYLVKPGR